jgi:hypothetical protein
MNRCFTAYSVPITKLRQTLGSRSNALNGATRLGEDAQSDAVRRFMSNFILNAESP